MTEQSVISSLCFACFTENVSSIARDDAYLKMMDLYFTAMNVDVKPSEFNQLNFCESCFDRILKFYDTNDTLLYFEKLLRTIQKDCVRVHIHSITDRKSKKLPTLWYQDALLNSI